MSSTAILFLVGLAAGACACGMYRRERNWERMKQAEATLGELAKVRLPAELGGGIYAPRESPDSVAFEFRRKNASHWNGYTSYAELLTVTIYAEDAPIPIARRAKEDVVEESAEGRWQWKVSSGMYDRDPVHEPAWRVVLVDRQLHVEYDWLGYQKQYSVATAKRNLLHLAGTLELRGDRKAFFAARRDWPTDGWRENFAENLARLQGVARVGEWTVSGPWRFAIDRERPQKLVLMYRLGTHEKDDQKMDFHGPVTKYMWWGDYLRQDNQGSEGGLLSHELLEAMRGEFSDRGTVYYYSVQTVNLWQKRDGVNIEEMKRIALELERRFRAGKLVTLTEL